MTTNETIQTLLEQKQFCSITKFVEKMKAYQTDEEILNARIYYMPTEVFKSKYCDYCLKPLYIILQTTKNLIYINHEKIINYFRGQPVICYNSQYKDIPKIIKPIYILRIGFKKARSSKGFDYFPIKVNVEESDKIVSKILSLIIKPLKNDNVDFENLD